MLYISCSSCSVKKLIKVKPKNHNVMSHVWVIPHFRDTKVKATEAVNRLLRPFYTRDFSGYFCCDFKRDFAAISNRPCKILAIQIPAEIVAKTANVYTGHYTGKLPHSYPQRQTGSLVFMPACLCFNINI